MTKKTPTPSTLLPRVIPACAALMLAVGCDQPGEFDDEASLAPETQGATVLADPVSPRFAAGGSEAAAGDEKITPLRTGSREVTRFAVGGTLDAPIADSQAEGHRRTAGEVSLPEHDVSLDWAELSGRDGEAGLVELPDEEATLLVRNTGPAPREVKLRLIGDAGTTLDRELGSVVLTVGPGETLEHRVALETLRPAEAGLTGQVRASAQVHDPETGEMAYATSGAPLYFRDDGAALTALGADALMAEPARGLAARATDAEAMDLLQATGEAEPTVTLRAQRWETTAEFQDLAIAAAGSEVEQTGGRPTARRSTGVHTKSSAYTLCVRFEIQTEDSGFVNSSGYTEDYWATANDGIVVPAYGVRVKVGGSTYDTDPDTGCVTFNADSSSQNVRVYAYATNMHDTFARMHDAGLAMDSPYPGNTLSWYVSNVQLSAGQTVTLSVGDYTPKATTMATLAYAMHRYGDGVYNSEYHVGLDADTCKTAHYGTVDNKAFLVISDMICTDAQTQKFVVTHEYGHGFGSLREQYFRGAAYHFDAPLSGSCPDQSSAPGQHKHNGIEFNFQAMQEGWADFVAAVVFNNKTQVANFTVGGNYEDLEEWNGSGSLVLAGGHLEWNCVPQLGDHQYLAGSANEADWTRMLWDMWTDPAQCSPAPSSTDMLRIYAATSTRPNFQHHLGWSHSQDAVDEVIASGQLGACYDDVWDDLGAYNGVDH